MLDVPLAPGEEVVQAEHVVAFGGEPLAEVGAQNPPRLSRGCVLELQPCVHLLPCLSKKPSLAVVVALAKYEIRISKFETNFQYQMSQ
jgi:hypothetical protein